MEKEIMLKRIATVLAILLLTILIQKPMTTKASEQNGGIGGSESTVRLLDSEGVATGTITMKDGYIKIETNASTASNSIRWRTAGLVISKNPIPSKTIKYNGSNLNGYEPISTIYSGGYGEPYYNKMNKEDTVNPTTGITTTTYEFTAQEVEDSLANTNFDDIVQDTPIYLHAIFETYQTMNGKDSLKRGNIRSWEGIVNAEYWENSRGQVNAFAQYYNMIINFQPRDQKNILEYKSDTGQTLDTTKNLDSVKPGGKVTWKNEDIVKNKYGKTYELYKYEIRKQRGSNSIIETHYIGDSHKCTIDNIKSGNVKVALGGMRVTLIYREKKGNKIQIQGVIKDTSFIIKDNLYTGEVLPNVAFSQAVDTIIDYNGKSYGKTVYNSYSYKTTSNVKQTNSFTISKADGPIAFKTPNDLLAGDTILVTAYYELSSPDVIPITINAIDKASGKLITTITKASVVSGTSFSYSVESPIIADSKKYDYAGDWKWYYKEKSTSTTTIATLGAGSTIKFTAPVSSKIYGGITIDVFYKIDDTGGSDIVLRTIMVAKTGAIIQELSNETVIRNQSIKKKITETVSLNSIVYEYMGKWDYTYNNGTKDTTTSGNGLNANFSIPSTTKLGSVVVLRIYYTGMEEVEVPEERPAITLPLDQPTPFGVINGDKYKTGYFESEESIPTTESQYVYVQTKDYLLGYNIVNRVGKMTYYVPVTMNYTLQFKTATPKEHGGPKDVTDVVTDVQYIKVERAYSYWEITNFEYYIINETVVKNYSLPDGKVNITPNHSLIKVPTLVLSHSSNKLDHLQEPKQVKEGIILESPVAFTSENSDRPKVEYEDLTAYAINMTDEIMVSNDYLVFDGVVVLSSSGNEKIAPLPNPSPLVHCTTITPEKALYTENEVIDATKINGVYASTGTVHYYRHQLSVQGSIVGKNYNVPVNKVTIHTPVICNPVIISDNEQWTQLINPAEDVYHIVLDPDSTLNDFTVKISNTLHHSDYRGYTIRDFSRSFIDPENISYIAKKEGVVRNEMRLPFDVYMDVGNDNKTENDEFIKLGTWIILGRSTSRFYVPMWVQEGVYTAQFRTIAVNGEDKLSYTEVERNASRSNYVATSRKNFQISGRIYGFTVYDIYDYPIWQDVFRYNKTTQIKYFEGTVDGTMKKTYNKSYAYYYPVGTKNQYGVETGRLSKYTVPMINNSHPQYNNIGVIKTGYAVRFRVNTTGEMYRNINSVRIIPSFYHVDSKGENRQLVDIYYNEEIKGKHHYLIKAGAGIDLVNSKEALVGNIYNKIPEKELKHTALVLDTTYTKLINKMAYMYNYMDIRMTSDFRTFVGLEYAKSIVKLPSYKKVKEIASLTELDLSKYMQSWYGTYKLPVDLLVAPAGYDVYDYMRKYGIRKDEDFWLKDGYIIVNFNIVTIDKIGKQYLSYINAHNYLNKGHNSMWVTEGGVLQKTDNQKATFHFKAGDVLLYYVNKSYRDDFEGVLN